MSNDLVWSTLLDMKPSLKRRSTTTYFVQAWYGLEASFTVAEFPTLAKARTFARVKNKAHHRTLITKTTHATEQVEFRAIKH